MLWCNGVMDIDNTSGHGAASHVPPSIRRWNWGAFLLNWIWGLGNGTLIALLMFVPLVNVVFAFVLGAKGSEWAWRNKRWESVAQFQAVQRRWAKWGVIAWLASIALFFALFIGLFAMLKDSDAYRLAQSRLQADERVVEIVGQPFTTGYPMGSIEISGPRGAASLSFGVEGPKGKGIVFVEAVRDLGQWQIRRMVFEEDGTGLRIDVVPGAATEPGAGRV